MLPGGLLGLLAAAAAYLHFDSRRELRDRHRSLEGVVAGAQADSVRAQDRLARQDLDAVAQVSTGFIARLLREFEGYTQVTRRGNRFRIIRIAPEFRDGFVELDVQSDFRWRVGLYDGPIAARYLAFARVTPDGQSWLYFRLKSARPLGAWPILNRLLEPIISLRMQRSLEMPDFRLPLGLRRVVTPNGADSNVSIDDSESAEPAESAESAESDRAGGALLREWKGIQIKVPERGWDLGPRRTLPLSATDRLGFVLERPGGASPDAGGDGLAGARDARWGGEDVQIAVRLRLLSELLAAAVARPDDITIQAGRIENVYRPTSGLVRALITERVDIAGLNGVFDLSAVSLQPVPGGLELALDVRGSVTGRLEGAMLGVGFSVPLRVESRTHEVLPLRVAVESAGLRLVLERDEIVIPLAIEAQVRKTKLSFVRELRLPAAAALSAVNVPRLVLADFQVPTLVERGEVVATRSVPLAIAWGVELPTTADGFVVARGRVQLGTAAPPVGPGER